jgi:hypothetical protein
MAFKPSQEVALMKKLLILPLIGFLLPSLPALAAKNSAGRGGGGRFSSSAHGFGGGSFRSSGSFGRSSHSFSRFNGGGVAGHSFNRSYGGAYSSYGSSRSNRYASRSSSPHYQSNGVSGFSRFDNRGPHLPEGLRNPVSGFPSRGPNGQSFSASLVSAHGMGSAPVRGQMSAIVHDARFLGRIQTYDATENRAGHYAWHSWNGVNFCHYHGRWGSDWYGWNVGGHFFWTQYYAGNFWSYNPVDTSWCYWNTGSGLWQDPDSAADYADDNGGTDSAVASNNAQEDNSQDNNGETADRGGNQAPDANDNAQASASNPSAQKDDGQGQDPNVFKSPDGLRMVEIQDDSGDAYLYDIVGGKDSKPIFLSSHVAGVKYSNKAGETQILVLTDDGGFQVFNADGSPITRGGPSRLELAPNDQAPKGIDS